MGLSNDLLEELNTSQLVMKYIESCSGRLNHLNKILEENVNTYNKEKLSIEAKVQSVTQFKNTIVKNTRVENKISSTDSSIENKINHFDEQIRMNEERRERDIKSIREKYETKMNSEIGSVEARCDKYDAYLKSQRKQLESKKECVIRDLSCNIVPTIIGDNFDEDNYPRLTKLKYDIDRFKKERDELDAENTLLNKRYLELLKKESDQLQQQRLYEIRQEQREEERKNQEARERMAKQREEQNKADRERQNKNFERLYEQDQRQLKIEENRNHFRKNVYPKLSDEYIKYFSAIGSKTRIEDMRACETVEELIEYIDAIKPQLIKLIKLEETLKPDDSKYFTKAIEEKFDELPFDKRLEIAQLTKVKQILAIKALIEEEDDDSDDE